MPRTTRRSEPSPTPESSAVEERNGTVEKTEHAAHSIQQYAQKTSRRLYSYIPHALRHRSKAEYYLMLYNALTLILWSYLATLVIVHLRTEPAPASLLSPPSGPAINSSTHKATAQLGAYLSRILQPISNVAAPKPSMTGIHISPPSSTSSTIIQKALNAWYTLLLRASTIYASRSIGLSALLIQSLAALEPFHAYLHLTRSPLTITLSQVFSRFFVIWYLVESSPSAQSSPWYASMLLAWSGAEIIRSTYYLLTLLRFVPPSQNTPRPLVVYSNVITTLRYTAFYLLYPLGASSEYALLLKGFPSFPTRISALRRMGEYSALVGVGTPPAWHILLTRLSMWVKEWDLGAWIRVPFTVIWPVSLIVLMAYMHQQRIKVLVGGKGRGVPGGRLRDLGGKKRD